MNEKRIGRYEIKGEIGRGGMATVYLAQDPRFRRDVAIKVLPRQFTHDPQFRTRFEQEAQIIAALEHSAIVPVHDSGEDDGQLYLVMRYMPGGSLADRLKEGPMPLLEVAKIMNRVAQALDRAHSIGVIHRDLKPGNILFDQYGDAFLADFGIAKMVEATVALTGSGIIGTPAYMSPEQVRGEKVNGRSDIYTLGVILFEMLTGHQPYQADTPIGMAFKHVHEPVPRLLNAKEDLPPTLELAIRRAMAKQSDERFSTAGDLAASVLSGTQAQGMLPEKPHAPPIPEPKPVLLSDSSLTEVIEVEPVVALPPPVSRPAVSASTNVIAAEKVPLDVATSRPVSPTIRPDVVTRQVVKPTVEPSNKANLPVWVWAVTAVVTISLLIWGIITLLPHTDTPIGPTSQPELAIQPELAVTPTKMVMVQTTISDTPTETNTPTILLLDVELGDTWTRPKDGMVMVYVSPLDAPFVLESGVDAPIEAYWIDKYEVSNAQYQLCVDAGACEPSTLVNDDRFNGNEYPVVGVSAFDAEAYSEWVGGVLPTEAEWEYAAVGDSGFEYPWGNEFDGTRLNFCDVNCEYGWQERDWDDGFQYTSPVNSFLNSGSWVGAANMAGNVWEWTTSWWDEQETRRVVRGGSWLVDRHNARATSRYDIIPNDRSNIIGFRVVVRHSPPP